MSVAILAKNREHPRGALPVVLAQRGCDYLILSECVNPGLELSDTHCTEVFRNEHIRIYALQPQEAA